jgi:hypothetical protein
MVKNFFMRMHLMKSKNTGRILQDPPEESKCEIIVAPDGEEV